MGFLWWRWAGNALCCRAQASPCSGFSCCRAQALGPWASVLFRSCGTWVRKLHLTGPAVPWCVKAFQARDQTFVPCLGRKFPIHCATREVYEQKRRWFKKLFRYINWQENDRIRSVKSMESGSTYKTMFKNHLSRKTTVTLGYPLPGVMAFSAAVTCTVNSVLQNSPLMLPSWEKGPCSLFLMSLASRSKLALSRSCIWISVTIWHI